MAIKMDEAASFNGSPVDKATRYGWEVKDAPGEMLWVSKELLQVDKTYQREGSEPKIARMTQHWSWVACGVLIVARRPSGAMFVIDGQHRLLAARRHSSIRQLPCLVFEAAEISVEARGFLDVNANRKPVTAMQKQRALVAVGDEIAVFVQQAVNDCGLVLDCDAANGINFVALLKRCASQHRGDFEKTLRACAAVCLRDGVKIHARLFAGIWHMQRKIAALDNARFMDRLNSIDPRRLIDAANRAASLVGYGNDKIFADGMLIEINKGLRHRFSLEERNDA